LDEVFVISRIIKVEVTLTETMIILIIVLLYVERKKWKSCFCFFTDGKQHKARELDTTTLRNHAPRSYIT